MTKHLFAGLFALVFLPLAVAAPPTLKEARQRWLRGNYGEARDLFETLAKDAKLRPAAPVGLSRPFVGRLDELAVYDRPLSPVDIRRHYDLGTAGRSLPR
jgi:hypothetical protein